MEALSVPPELLAPLIAVPLTILALGGAIAMVLYKFTRFLVNGLIKLTLSFIVLASSMASGLFLYKNPELVKQFKPQEIVKLVKFNTSR